jgi:hypothetical protein
MEPRGSLPCSQQPCTGRYPGPDEFIPYLHTVCFRSTLILISHLHLGFPCSLFPSAFPTNIFYSFMRATCLAHPTLIDVMAVMFGEEYKLRSSLLCNFIHSLVTSSVFGLCIICNTSFSEHLQPSVTLRPIFIPVQNNG